jgi:hypothetical protein
VPAATGAGEWLTPEQAVFAAASAAPEAVPGTFSLHVRATGAQGSHVYLNSEQDYRDQRNLTIALTTRAASQLALRLGSDPLEALMGKDILVKGSAVRTKIYLVVNGQATDKYYYQTHVNVADAGQIAVR